MTYESPLKIAISDFESLGYRVNSVLVGFEGEISIRGFNPETKGFLDFTYDENGGLIIGLEPEFRPQ